MFTFLNLTLPTFPGSSIRVLCVTCKMHVLISQTNYRQIEGLIRLLYDLWVGSEATLLCMQIAAIPRIIEGLDGDAKNH